MEEEPEGEQAESTSILVVRFQREGEAGSGTGSERLSSSPGEGALLKSSPIRVGELLLARVSAAEMRAAIVGLEAVGVELSTSRTCWLGEKGRFEFAARCFCKC